MTNEQLVSRIQNGEAGLMDMLLEQNRGYIWRVAVRYTALAERNRGLDVEDLLQAARLGMIEAIPEWDSERGMFLTIATLYMKRNIREALGIRTEKERIENVAPPASLSAPVGEDDGDLTLGDCLADHNAVDPQQAAENALMGEYTTRTVHEAVEGLPENQRDVITTYFFEGLPLRAVACKLGVDAAHAEQTKRKALGALGRNRKITRLWEEYDAAAFTMRSYASWTYTHTSATEAAAIRREELGLMGMGMRGD